jgi:hypothetical protein
MNRDDHLRGETLEVVRVVLSFNAQLRSESEVGNYLE